MKFPVFVFLVGFLNFVKSVDYTDDSVFGNAISGDVNLTCHDMSVIVNFDTIHSFVGNVYIDLHTAGTGWWDAAKDTTIHDNDERTFCETGSLGQLIAAQERRNRNQKFPLLSFSADCPIMDSQRQQIRNPGPLSNPSQSYIVTISFHPIFLTGSDRSFEVTCAPPVVPDFVVDGVLEETYTVSAAVNVVRQQPESIGNIADASSPCFYRIKPVDDHGLGSIRFRNVLVGAMIRHEWYCANAYAIRVHSCTTQDSRTGRVTKLNDQQGCSLAPGLIANVQYNEDTSRTNLGYKSTIFAKLDTKAFRFHDTERMRFECKIDACYQKDCISTYKDNTCRAEDEPARSRRTVSLGKPQDTVYAAKLRSSDRDFVRQTFNSASKFKIFPPVFVAILFMQIFV